MEFRERNRIRLERVADVATRWIGSTASLGVHTLLFIISFLLPILRVVDFDKMLLILTTIVSLEAIYLAIFIQMSVNKNSMDIENIQEDIEEIQEDVEEIQEDVEEIQEDVEEIQEDVEELQEEPDPAATSVPTPKVVIPVPLPHVSNVQKLRHIQLLLAQLQSEIEALKKQVH